MFDLFKKEKPIYKRPEAPVPVTEEKIVIIDECSLVSQIRMLEEENKILSEEVRKAEQELLECGFSELISFKNKRNNILYTYSNYYTIYEIRHILDKTNIDELIRELSFYNLYKEKELMLNGKISDNKKKISELKKQLRIS